MIQRVSRASVRVEGELVSSMGPGLLVLLGIADNDGPEDLEWLVHKVANLRIFNDEHGVMNRSVLELGGELIVVSQFTLQALTKKGNRPSYIRAARPEAAISLYEAFTARMEEVLGRKVGTGIFGADMKVELLNDGPVTLLIDTKNRE